MPTHMTLQLVDHSITRPYGVIEDVLVKVKHLIFPADFVVIDIEEDVDIPLILSLPFMSIASCVVDMGKKMLQMGIEDQKISFDLFHEDKEPPDRNVYFIVHVMKERRPEKKLSALHYAKPNIFTVSCTLSSGLSVDDALSPKFIFVLSTCSGAKPESLSMASRKRKAPSTPSQVRYDRSRFTSQEAWERYTDIIVPRKFLPERNVVVYTTEFDEFLDELDRRHWREELTNFLDGNIDVSIVKEFYANLYDPEDKSPKQVRVRDSEEEHDTLAQTWSVLSFSNLIPTSHTSDVTLDRARLIYGIIMKILMNVGYLISHQMSLIAQHDTSRLGFPALIIALCKTRGVQPDSRSLESLSPAINLAYIKKNCWNLDDPTVTFRGPRKARGDQPSSSGGGGASAADELDTEEPLAPAHVEEETTPDQTPQPCPAPAHIPEDAAPVAESEQLIQDSSAAPTLDLNEDQPQEEKDV
ncbi:hypothetical protein HKD37_04G010873 [Glycine soja]